LAPAGIVLPHANEPECSGTIAGEREFARMKTSDRIASCPACGRRRDVDGQRALCATERAWFDREAARVPPTSHLYPRADGMRQLAVRGERGWFWACDGCLQAKRALKADVARQNLGLGTPFAAYVDRPFHCADCAAKAVFSAAEQRHWFEKLGFLIWVYPKQCASCRAQRRRKKRSNRALADALAGLDQGDPGQLDAVARLYDEIGAAGKAATYRARAKNRRAGKGRRSA